MIQNKESYLGSFKFQSRDELLKGVRAFYWNKGYELSIRNSRKDKFVLLKCDLGGSYQDTRDIADNQKKEHWNAFENKNQPSVIITDRELALMNAIEEVFPSTTSLLCIWHINKNVFANCKTHFAIAEEFDIFMSNWNNLVYSTTKADYVKSLDEFELLYKDKKDAIKAEGAHAKLKLYLQASTGGFQELLSHVSHFALKEIHKQYEKSKSVTPCTSHYTATMDLPCAHKIKDWNEVALSLELIHPHRRINTVSMNREDGLQNDGDNRFVKLLEELNSKYQPVIQRPMGRPRKPKKNKGITSTRREPSKFEIVESSRAHNPSSSTRVFHNNNGAADEFSYIHQGKWHKTVLKLMVISNQ
ncbi:PKS-NRPS hybrid synthetase, partial [Tanacetum coccineum]